MMVAVSTLPARPFGAIWQGARRIMEIVLHVGAHRTGTTSFQHYLRSNMDRLNAQGISVWGPLRTRRGLFNGLWQSNDPLDTPKRRQRARGRVRIQAELARRKGVQTLVVSDENMIGSARENLRRNRLYPGLGERMARVDDAFDGRITRIVLSIRALEAYWASAMAFAVPRGLPLPDEDRLDRIVTQPRSWRAVIGDLACAVPGAQILVAPFEHFAGRSDDLLDYMTAGRIDLPPEDGDNWRNRSPGLGDLRQVLRDRGETEDLLPPGEGRWQPFGALHGAALRETYADDLHWLRAGAGGAAMLIEETGPDMAGQTPPGGLHDRGHRYDGQDRGLARAR